LCILFCTVGTTFDPAPYISYNVSRRWPCHWHSGVGQRLLHRDPPHAGRRRAGLSDPHIQIHNDRCSQQYIQCFTSKKVGIRYATWIIDYFDCQAFVGKVFWEIHSKMCRKSFRSICMCFLISIVCILLLLFLFYSLKSLHWTPRLFVLSGDGQKFFWGF